MLCWSPAGAGALMLDTLSEVVLSIAEGMYVEVRCVAEGARPADFALIRPPLLLSGRMGTALKLRAGLWPVGLLGELRGVRAVFRYLVGMSLAYRPRDPPCITQ